MTLMKLLSTSLCFQPIFQQGKLIQQKKPLVMQTKAMTNDYETGSISSDTRTNKKRCFEVEEKFSISELDMNILENKLGGLGFEKKGDAIEFMDWYFDLPDPDWILSISDNWLRYRELLGPITKQDDTSERNGSWQIKCGKVIQNNNSGTTVYEELEGDEAIDLATSMIRDKSNNVNNLPMKIVENTMDGFLIPSLPKDVDCNLIPFARIKTTRSSWVLNDVNYASPLSVDLDCTDYGYLVGEVELVVDREEDIDVAQQLIKRTIEQITDTTYDERKATALGKLELYMIRNRKEHFEECVRHGSIENKIEN